MPTVQSARHRHNYIPKPLYRIHAFWAYQKNDRGAYLNVGLLRLSIPRHLKQGQSAHVMDLVALLLPSCLLIMLMILITSITSVKMSIVTVSTIGCPSPRPMGGSKK